MKRVPRSIFQFARALAVFGAIAIPTLASAAPVHKPATAPLANPAAQQRLRDPDAIQPAFVAPGTTVPGNTMKLSGSAKVNLTDLARTEARQRSIQGAPPVRVLVPNELNESEEQAPPTGPIPFMPTIITPRLNIASPSPSNSFIGLDDIPMADSSYIIIPPDVGGGVGPTRVMDTFNNNYRIQDKITGATVLTVGTATFWNPVVANKTLLNQLTDPRTTYDPIQNRWIVCMQTVNNPGLILFGVSQTSDPAGSWFLYAVTPGFTSSPRLDFPVLGFNKNWIAITINAYSAGGSFNRGGCMIANYPLAAAGTLASVTNVTQASGTHFCTAPCVTISATEDTLFVLRSTAGASATYELDRITGTPAAPTYTSGATNSLRTGGAWATPTAGNLLPQSVPNSGASSCGATPCKIETQDDNIRTAPMYRVDATTGRGFIYYAQSVGLPSAGQTHVAAQWTKITAGATPAFADGGRIEDATATVSNGGKWYVYPHIATNSLGDFVVGYSQFSSAQHPSAGYSYHDHTDALASTRDPFIYKAGEDYYQKQFGAGRNRWGDFSTAQVDPSDDKTIWVLQEYGKTRTSTDDNTTGSNGSKWSTYWASVVGQQFTITASAGAGGTVSPSGSVLVTAGANQTFTITANSCFAIANVIVDGVSQGAVASFTFTNVTANHTITASFSALGPYTIAASAGTGGAISPSGNVSVSCGANQTFAITPDACHTIASVLVDGVSQGAIASFTFSNVQANHTISATFNAITYTITASAGAGGAISPNGAVGVVCSNDQAFTVTPSTGYSIADVLVDGVSVGAVASYTFSNVTANHTIAASFALTPGTISAQSTATYLCPTNTCVTIPVSLSRTYNNPVLGFSVTFQLSPDLTLCSGTGSVTEGTFLSAAGATLFNVADHGGGSYSADGAVLGGDCGPTGLSGLLFNIGVASTAPGGTGTVTITSVKLRDCGNGVLPVNAGPPATVPIDNEAPAVTVTSPNGGENWPIGSSQTITWTATDNTGVANVDLAYSTDGGATYPFAIATAVANSGSYAWTVPNAPTTQARVRVTAHDVVCATGSDASDADFRIGDLAITASAGAGGTITPSGAVAVAYNANQSFAIAPASTCYIIADVLVDGVSVGAVSTYTFNNVIVDHTIAASFTLLGPYTITTSAGPNGSITPTFSVACGSPANVTITPDPCYQVADVLVDGVSVGPVTLYTFTDVHANHTVSATFAVNTYTITASAGPNGSISPTQTVNCGDKAAFTITADPCYHVADVLVDGVSVGGVTSYSFPNVQANHAISATFAPNAVTITAVTGLGATQVRTGNDADGTTKVTLAFTAPGAAASVEVWRRGYGNYPLYDNAPGSGSVPAAPASYPPAGWTLTAVTATGQTDEPATRDYWYYAAYAKDACGNASPVSNVTGGTLDYHLGDVTDGTTPGQGNNQVTTADISLLGTHYGLSGAALAGFEYLDVGPTTDASVNGRPTTDSKTDFEDLVMFALNYFPVASTPSRVPVATPAAANVLRLSTPARVSVDEGVEVPVELQGAGDLKALSVTLGWNAAVVVPVDVVTGDLITAQGGVMFSPGPGAADMALLNPGGPGMTGQGVVATVRFRAIAAGDPGFTFAKVLGRDGANQAVTVTTGIALGVDNLVTVTDLKPVIPNPSRDRSLVQYGLAKRGPVELSIYSVDGRRVRTLMRGDQEVGQYRVTWDGRNEAGTAVQSGVYFIRLDAAGVRRTRLITMIK